MNVFYHAPRALFVVVFALLLTPGCTCDADSVNRGDINLVPLDEEWAMGDQLAGRLAQRLTFVEDPAVQQYVEQMGQQIVAQTELSGREWTFRVVADPSLNAFVTPGGHVYVHAGLIAAADTPAQLASVMAHEVAHGIARHSTEQMTQAYGIDAVAGLFLDGESGALQQALTEFARSGAIAKFSRDDEREADELGQQYMAEVGYAPSAMPAMFEKLQAARAERPNAVEQFFSSHPLTEERVQAARQRAQDLGGPPEASASAEFQAIQQRLGQAAVR